MRSAKQFLFGSLGAALALSGVAVLTAGTAQAASTGMIINEVYGGGGSTSASAAYKSDFVELLNPTGTAQPLNGLSLQYRSATYGGTGTVSVLPLPDVSVPAGSKYLVQVSNPNNCSGNPCGGADVPAPDYSGTALNMAGSNGQVMLVQGVAAVTAVGTSMHTAANVVDFVGYGTASSSETAPAGALSTTTSVQRKNTTDGDNNATDFNAPATPSPEGLGAIAQPLSATNPGNKTFTRNQAISPITLQASGGTSPYTWAVTAGTLPDGLELAGNQIGGTPTTVTPSPVEITVTATDSATPTPATATATFTIQIDEQLAVTPIAEIQGTGARSPFAPETGNGQGAEVKATEGVVTAVYYTGGFNGMYIQTPGVDTPDASDGLFVYGGTTNANIPAGIQVGDSVRVTGRIAEFYNLTQIVPGAGGVTVLGTSLGTVTPRAFTYPTTDEEREKYEGELVDPQGTFTVSNVYSTNDFGEITLASGEGPLKQPSEFADASDPDALQAVRNENARRAVALDDGSTTRYLSSQATKAQPLPWLTGSDGNAVAAPPRVGAGVEFQSDVVFDWRNDIWKFQPQSQVTTNGASVATFEDTRAADATPADVLTMTPGRTGDLKIATFNVLNYFNTTGEAYSAAGPLQEPPLDTFCTYYTDRGDPGPPSVNGARIGNNSCGVRLLDDPTTPDKDESKDNDGRGPRGAATAASLARQEAKLVHTINALGADVVGLEEVENSIKLPGETNRDDAVARLVDILNAAPGADTWAYVKSPGEALTAAAVAEQDVIRPAFIYKVAKVEPVGGSDILFGTTEFANAREPLAQVFKAKGAPDSDGFAVIVNHFKSKGDNQAPIPPATGDNAQNGEVGAFNGDRVRQATRLVQFAEDFAAEREVDAVFLAGDFNSYTKEDPIGVLTAADYTLIESNDEGDESYSYQGLSGSLDHVLGNQAAMDMVTGADIWEINANEAASFQYSRYNYNVTDFWLPNQPWATSDHNPEIVGLDVPDFTPTSYKEIQVIGTNDFHGRLLPDAGNAAGAAPFATAVKDLEGQFPPGATAFVAAGDLVGASTFESFIQDDEPTIDALNAMGLDVSAAGNHEFDRGYTDLADRIRGLADWEYIAANLDYAPDVAESDKLAETWTTTLDGVEVGFVGAVTEDLPGLVNPEGIEDITVTDVVDATNAAADALKTAGAEIVILLVHEGAPTTDCNSASFTDPATVWGNIVQNTSADVDAIISGHTHLAYNCRYPVPDWQADSSRTVKKRPVVSAGQYGTNLNQLVFKFDESSGDLKAIGQDVIAAAGVGYAPDPTVQAIVDDAVDYAAAEGATILGKMTGPFKRATYTSSAGATENRGGESTLSNQIAEVQRWATDAAGIETDIAFMNPGGLRADMDGTDTGAGVNLSFREAADVQPFANTLVNMKLTGAQLEEILEQQWQRTATGSVPSRPFLRLGVSQGFTYTYDETPVTVTAPNSAPVQTFQGEVTGMWLDGEPVDAAQVYSVTVNSFLGGGGDNFWTFADGAQKVDTGKVDLEAMVDYMKQYATDPLPVDYSQRGVEITLPDDAPASYGPGDTVEFEVGSWTMSAPGDQHDSELEVRLSGTVLGTFAVDNAVGNQPYDRYGTSSVSVTLPNDVFNGATELTVSGVTTGTSIPVVVQIAGGQEPTETPVVNQVPPSVSGTARIGQTLTASAGTWQPQPSSVAYQWYADGAPIPGATGRTLVLGSGQVGTRITVAVTAHAAGHADATAISAQVGPVAKGSATVAVKTKPKKIKLRKTKAKVVVTVTTQDGVAVTDSVTIKAKGQKARTVAVVNGKAKVKLKAFTSTGAKRIKIGYSGSALLAPAKSVTTVWVVRR
ncbi:ExeM/NucH family extracellular endonuclease [Nocardioides sp. L-11A]|uniref:ExeM/NucH family extracellular endonuclease n=1 Tax=Nocardioides sp. L-11A TaxID=3043848 RepID=UPI00249C7966|nr:ExeM/NucH family extracellular endonuclease [Nocardioides sp. L-11A]